MWKSRPRTWIETLRTGTVPIAAAKVPAWAWPCSTSVARARRSGRRGDRCRGTPGSPAPRRRASRRSARSAAARSGSDTARSRASPCPAPPRSRGLCVHLAQQRLAEVRQMRAGEAADEALQAHDADLDPEASHVRQSRSSTVTHPLAWIASTSSSRRFACQSWLPSTANTGMPMPRHASARTAPSSGSPVVVRSPASSRSPPVPQRGEALDHCVAVVDAAVHVASSRDPHERLLATPVAVGAHRRGRALGRALAGAGSCRLLVHQHSPTPHRCAASVASRGVRLSSHGQRCQRALRRDRGGAAGGRPGAARSGDPVHARRQHGRMGLRRPRADERPRPDDPRGGRRACAARAGGEPACAPSIRRRSGS